MSLVNVSSKSSAFKEGSVAAFVDNDDVGAEAVDEGVTTIKDGGGGRSDGGGLAPASWRLGGAVGSVPVGNGGAVLEAGNPMRLVRRLPVPG